ncbi:hypothetical protein EU527_05380 [Candidatus Thorarchaeota archaeon]|nr:MAG: hypothetical protein EU527_05380 [Candidatus Thorarchaeota archaeon]
MIRIITITLCLSIVAPIIVCFPHCTIIADTPTVSSETIPSMQKTDTPSISDTNIVTDSFSVAPQYTDTIAIIVQNSIYSGIVSAVNQYRQDLNDSGYNTILYTQPVNTAEELKGNLSEWFDSSGLVGAVLIGRLPYAEFHHDATTSFSAETFICDLFLMDLDGTWSDTSPIDGIYDTHYATTGTDIYPEIFVGRIDPTCLSWDSVTNNINTYLSRVHDYRTGGVTRDRRGLFYIDNDWAGYWGSRWASDGAFAYSTHTLVQTPTTYTNATDWLTNRILQNYQWGHLCAHSSPTAHYFGPRGSGEGSVSSSQIHNAPPSFNFYNLFCCSGAKWTTTNNLGVTYTFSGTYSLASIGSSKTGSMMDCDEFYGPLGQNNTLGQSLSDWFSNSLTSSSTAGDEYLPWYYGMNIVGDPLLTIYYDCTVLIPSIHSNTHPDQGTWYSNQRPQINWTEPADVNSIVGYYYILNQYPNTVPTKLNGIYTTVTGLEIDEDLASGIWYFHVVAVDSEGNIGSNPAHYTISIDASGPSLNILHPLLDGYYSTNTIKATWSSHDYFSGYVRSLVWVDTSTNVVHNGSLRECTLTGLSEGDHILNVTSFDLLQNSATQQITFHIDLTDPDLLIIEPLAGAIIIGTVFLDWTVADTGSGYHYSEIYLDGILLDRVDAPVISYQITGLPSGSYTVDVIVYDWAGRFSLQSITITIESSYSTSTITTTTTTTTSVQLSFTTILHISIVVLAGIVLVIFIIRKRR